MHYLIVIPARGESKRLPRKNLRVLNGKPLVAWSIEQALAVAPASRVLLSTDSPEIAEAGRACGLEVPFLRPAELAGDAAPTEPVLLHALDWYEQHRGRPDAVILLQPTSPVRRPGSIARAIEQFERDGADSLVSVAPTLGFLWRNPTSPEANYDYRHRPRSQDIADDARWHLENGSIYITDVRLLRAGRNRLGGRISMFVMDESECCDIDSPVDWVFASALLTELEMR